MHTSLVTETTYLVPTLLTLFTTLGLENISPALFTHICMYICWFSISHPT